MSGLLAVDLGLRTGLACFARTGRLVWYRSHNLGTRDRLRRRAAGLLTENPGLTWLILEGGGPLATIWQREAQRREIQTRVISAEQWRPSLLNPSQHRDRGGAKNSADQLARRVIEWSDAPRPTSLRHDAAEAILIGLWAAVEIGWLKQFPSQLR